MAKLSTSNIGTRKNLIINGDMRVAQRGTSFAGLGATDQYTLDRWYWFQSGASAIAVVTISQDTDVPTGEGFSSSLKVDCTTAETGDNSDDASFLRQSIEAQNLQHLAWGTSSARDLVYTFWMKSDTKIGVMGLAFYQHDANRHYLTEITIPDNNWNKYTVIVPGDTSGSFNDDNGIGLWITFALESGSAFDTTAETWLTTSKYSTTSTEGFLQSTANNLWLTGVQLEVGTVANQFDHRSFAEELRLCQRYYVSWSMGASVYPFGTAFATNTTSLRCSLITPVELRDNPTMDDVFGYYGNGVFKAVGSISGPIKYPWGITFLDTNSGLTQYETYNVVPPTATLFGIDAEL